MRRQCASWARSRCGVCVEAHSSRVRVLGPARDHAARLDRRAAHPVDAETCPRRRRPLGQPPSGSPARTVDSTTTLSAVAWSCGRAGPQRVLDGDDVGQAARSRCRSARARPRPRSGRRRPPPRRARPRNARPLRHAVERRGRRAGKRPQDRDRFRPRHDLAPVSTASTPACPSAAATSSAGCARAGTGSGRWRRGARAPRVVEEAAAAAQQAIVLLALHAGAEPGELIHPAVPRPPGADSARRPRRCSGSPCSGRGCRRAPRGAPRPRGQRRDWPAPRRRAESPACSSRTAAPCASRNACCTRVELAPPGEPLDGRDRRGRAPGTRA